MGSTGSNQFEYALKSNEAWANYKAHQNPNFFPALAAGQNPGILWIGCCDSRVPETTILGLQPGDVFVHRSIANILSPTDLSYLAALEYAVEHVKVKHVVLCGHTGCGGCAGAFSDARIGGVLDMWLGPLKALRIANEKELMAIKDVGARLKRLAELNVQKGVETLMSNYTVKGAVKESGLTVHGLLFDLATGRLTDLKIGTSGSPPTKTSLAKVSNTDGAEEYEIVKGNHGQLVFTGEEAEMSVR